MPTGYIRQDTTNNINNGNTIDALYLDQEFDAIVAAFNTSSGHNHDGTAAGGAPIINIGPAQDFVATAAVLRPKTTAAYDLGSNAIKFKDAYFSGTINAGTIVGNIDSTNLTGTIASARIAGSYTGIVGVGALNAGSITSGFGSINIGTSTITCGTVFSGTVNSTGGVFANQDFISTSVNAVISNDGTGTIFLRPKGSGNTTGQVRVNNDGSVLVNGDLTANNIISNGNSITNLNASNLSSGTVPNARLAGAYSDISSLGTLTSLTVDNIFLDGTSIANTADNSIIRIYGGSTGSKIELAGANHAVIPWTINYDSNFHVFRNGDSTAIRAVLSNVLAMGTNVPISFSGTGAATTRTNLGLGNISTKDEGTGSADFRNNADSDARYHITGVNTLPSTDLPSNTGGRDWVLGRIAAGQNNTSGMYSMLRYDGTTTVNTNGTVTGQLFFSGADGTGTGAATGTWKLMGRIGNSAASASARTSIWLKVSD